MSIDYINKHPVEYVLVNNRVIAQIKSCEYDACEKVEDYDDRYRMCFKYKAIAKCAPGDAYDETTGKRIAYRRLEQKYYKALNKRMFKWATVTNTKIASLVHEMNFNLEKHIEIRASDAKLFHPAMQKGEAE